MHAIAQKVRLWVNRLMKESDRDKRQRKKRLRMRKREREIELACTVRM